MSKLDVKAGVPIKTLRFSYAIAHEYDREVTGHHILLRCFPQNTARQRVDELELTVEPATRLAYDEDHFGNRTASGVIAQPHSGLRVTVRGKVQAGLDIYEGIECDELNASAFRYASRHTFPGEALKAYHAALDLERESGVYAKVNCIMRCLSRDMHYQKGVTDIHTTAEDAVLRRLGVCQDYAHIMLALCRMERIPARYVVGLMRGEGQSHAWVEALCKGYWYGFDPTNDLLVDDNYVKFSHGRDYEDCVVDRGVFTGTASQRQRVEALVSEQ